MRSALLCFILAACGPSRASRPCPAPPAPAADVFSACGGMVYHTPPGTAVRYSVKFVNHMSAQYELRDLCILLDGLPLFTAKDIEAAPRDVKWDGRISFAQHRVRVQAVYAVRMSTGVYDYVNGLKVTLRAARDIGAIDGGSLEIDAHEQGGPTTPLEKRPAIKMNLPKDTPEPRCDY